MPNELRVDPISETTSKRMSKTSGQNNSREREIRSRLHRLGFRFRIHRPILPGTRRTADIAFTGLQVAVFADGCFWHGCPKHGTSPKNNSDWWLEKIAANKTRDSETDKRLRALGWKSIRIWEHENIDDAIARIVRVLQRVQSNRK